VSAALLSASPASGQGQRPAGDAVTGSAPPSAPGAAVTDDAAPPPERRPLMNLLDRVNLAQPLEESRIRVFGYVEGSATYNPHPTDAGTFGDINLDRLFDFDTNQLLFNQLNLTVERPVALSRGEWDVGFRTEVIYGSDARWLHANGLNFYGSGIQQNIGAPLQFDPENQFDLFQAYVDFGVPVGEGMRLRVGKFASFFGGTVDPNLNTFYSRSVFFADVRPLTFTGVLATYSPSERLTLDAGFSRGWDQSLKDNNDALDVLGRVTYLFSDRTSIALAAVTGPEQADDNGNYRTLLELTFKHQLSDRLRMTLDGTYLQEAHFHGPPDVRNGKAYDLTAYFNYLLNDRFTLNARAEVFQDDDGIATGIVGTTYSGTIGVAITPFPGDATWKYLKIRPEVRLDYSPQDRYGEDLGDLDRNEQLTFAVDAIFNF
jgi:hypothetical protein